MDRTTVVSLPRLIAGLKSPSPAERFDAALALGRMGGKARRAVPALIEALRDTDKNAVGCRMAMTALNASGARRA